MNSWETSEVVIRRTGRDGPWGETLAMRDPDVPRAVREEIADALSEGNEAGGIEVDGQAWRWWVAADDFPLGC